MKIQDRLHPTVNTSKNKIFSGDVTKEYCQLHTKKIVKSLKLNIAFSTTTPIGLLKSICFFIRCIYMAAVSNLFDSSNNKYFHFFFLGALTLTVGQYL